MTVAIPVDRPVLSSCSSCGAKMERHLLHTFVCTDHTLIRYCRACCPRCDGGPGRAA